VTRLRVIKERDGNHAADDPVDEQGAEPPAPARNRTAAELWQPELLTRIVFSVGSLLV
jgi:hypothetical protein